MAYFYFDISDKTKQTSRNLLTSLVLHLTAKSNNHAPMKRLHEKHDKLYTPTEDELIDLLMELIQCFKEAYIVIDALDESDDYHYLHDEVIKVMHEGQLSHFHLLVSSRNEQNIITTMKEYVTAEICLSAELIGSDIISYIHYMVEKKYWFKRWGQAGQQHIKQMLISGANGMYVSIVLLFSDI